MRASSNFFQFFIKARYDLMCADSSLTEGQADVKNERYSKCVLFHICLEVFHVKTYHRAEIMKMSHTNDLSDDSS